MSIIDVPVKCESTIYDQFKSMNLKPAVDSNSLASSKAEKYAKFCGFVNGKFIQTITVDKEGLKRDVICDAISGEPLCEEDGSYENLISFAVKSSAKGFKSWSTLSLNSRSKILLSIAQTIEKYQQLFIALESLSSGKHAFKVKTKDIPYLIESFEYYAGCVMQLEEEIKAWFPTGPACIITEEYNNPSLAFSLRVSSLLASGCSALLLPDIKSSLSALFLAEICSESGVPEGVFNVILVDQEKIKALRKWPAVSKFLLTGSFEKALAFSKISSETLIPYDVLIPRRPIVIVYENANLHSAAESVLEATFYHDTRSKSGGCKVLVQECIYSQFLKILESRFSNILIGRNVTKTDLSCEVTEEQKTILTECIEEAKTWKAKVTTLNSADENLNYTHIMPSIISGLQTSCKIVHEELGGPVIVIVPFRTVKESISMFNCDNKGSPVSIWTEKISVALEVALKLKSSVVWVNSENVIDARTAFSGVYSSGTSVEGGKDALFSHLSVLPETSPSEENKTDVRAKQVVGTSTIQGVTDDKIEYKLYIGGIQKQSENGTILINENTLVPNGTEKDIKSAVSSAVAIQPKWEAMTDSQKRKIFHNISSKLRMNRTEYVTELQKISDNSVDSCEKEVADTLDLLYYWASQNEALSGPAQEIKKNLIVLQNRNPLGVIGIQCPDEKPLLSFVSLVIPAIIFGNTVIAVTSEKYPILALKMCELFTLSNVPGGVLNVVCGSLTRLMPILCKHSDVNAIWYNNVPAKCIFSNQNVTQRIFCCKGMWNSFNKAKSMKFALESTYTKTVFLPAGEIFAN